MQLSASKITPLADASAGLSLTECFVWDQTLVGVARGGELWLWDMQDDALGVPQLAHPLWHSGPQTDIGKPLAAYGDVAIFFSRADNIQFSLTKDASGTITVTDAMAVDAGLGGLGASAIVSDALGQTHFYTLGGAEGALLTQSLDHGGGFLTAPQPVFDGAEGNGFTALLHATFAPHLLLATTSETLELFSVSTEGGLSALSSLGPAQGLWIADATSLAPASVGGRDFVIIGAAGSNSLSVAEIGAAGALTLRDQIIDDRLMRFESISTLQTINVGAHCFVVAAGADDGVTIFQLMPNGLLIERATIEDTTALTLANVASLAVWAGSEAVQIAATSQSEGGVSVLTLRTGLLGHIIAASAASINGSDGPDILVAEHTSAQIAGGAGDDILMDGLWSDTLTGGDGADVFVLRADQAADRITDFEPLVDSLDLSHWPMLRDVSQLDMRMTDTGLEIRYGDELLVVDSADGQPIDYRILQNSDLIGPTRLIGPLTAGEAGPERPSPVITTEEDAPNGTGTPDPRLALSRINTANADLVKTAAENTRSDSPALRGTSAADNISGDSLDNLIFAMAGDDVVYGGAGSDILFGHGGDDLLDGGADPDFLFGGDGNDALHGGAGNDRLSGGDGDDLIDAGQGDDWMQGGAGADHFIFSGGHDQIVDFSQTEDQITFGPQMWTGLTNAADVLRIYGTFSDNILTLQFDDANILTIIGIDDPDTIYLDINLF